MASLIYDENFLFSILDYRTKGTMTGIIEPCKNEVCYTITAKNIRHMKKYSAWFPLTMYM